MERRTFLKRAGAVIGGTAVVGGAYVYRFGVPGPGGDDEFDGIDPENGTFVSTDGDDDAPGTEARPLATLETAIDGAEPGDAIVVRGGIYDRDERIEITDLKGESDRPVTITGAPEERPIFDFGGSTPGGWDANGGIRFQDVSGVVVRNLVVRNSPYFGMLVVGDSTDNVFEDLTIHDNNLSGFAMHDGPSKNTVRRLVSAANYDPQNGGQNADGIQFARADQNTVSKSQFCYNSDDGLDLWGSRDVEVNRCLSWRNGHGEEGDGTGFKLGGDGESGGHRIIRSVAFDNLEIGFSYNDATVPMTLYNNTAWNNPNNFSVYEADHELTNNIAADGETGIGSDVADEHNTWNRDIEDPEFASYSLRNDRFLHLSAGSPCIGVGTDVGLEYAGDAPDLGAYEYDPD